MWETGNDMVPWVEESLVAMWPGRRLLWQLSEGANVVLMAERPWEESTQGSPSAPAHGEEMAFLLPYDWVPLIRCCILSLLSFQGLVPLN